MARRKTKRRTYNLGTSQASQRTGNNPRETEGLLVEETPQEAAVNQQQDKCPVVATLTKTSQVPWIETLESDLAKSVCQNSPTTECQEDPTVHIEETVTVSEEKSTITSKPQEKILHDFEDKDIDWLMADNFVSVIKAPPTRYVDKVVVNDSLSTSRIAPLNLTWDSSMKENCRQQANAPNFRPMTPDNLTVPVDDVFSPNTQKEIRATIRALFPNGPPPPPPVRPMRRPKKGDEPYIVNCTKRPRVPSPKSLNVFTGDKFGITTNSNYDVDEPEEKCTPEKRAKRGAKGSTSKSTFNGQTNEIAERLKLYEKIDRLVGRTPKESVGYMTKRSFSPMPSTSTDNDTIMQNDRHFRESFICDFDIDEDDELPEVIWGSYNSKKEEDRKKISSPLVSNDIKKENNEYTHSVLTEMNEHMKNNNDDVIVIDDDLHEIEFDKYMPKEKLIYYSDVEPKKESEDAAQKKRKIDDYFPVQSKNQPLTPSRVCPTTSTNVICVDNMSTNVLNPITSANLVDSPVHRASNKNATATETQEAYLDIIEVPDDLEPISMSRHALNLPTWNDEVEFVSEERTERPGQVISQPSNVGNRTPEIMYQLKKIVACFIQQCECSNWKPKNKRTKSKENVCVPNNETASVNNENTAPIHIENASINNENAAPSVNQVSVDSNSVIPSANSSPSKMFGECPICYDNLLRDSIASTNCGHVFCLDCIKQSLKTSGKKCPTCRKQLKGIGYHQVFL